jgi:hypothetical protein
MYEGVEPPSFESFFPRDVNPQALDLLQKMVCASQQDDCEHVRHMAGLIPPYCSLLSILMIG